MKNDLACRDDIPLIEGRRVPDLVEDVTRFVEDPGTQHVRIYGYGGERQADLSIIQVPKWIR